MFDGYYKNNFLKYKNYEKSVKFILYKNLKEYDNIFEEEFQSEKSILLGIGESENLLIKNYGNIINILGKIDSGKTSLSKIILSQLIFKNENSITFIFDAKEKGFDYYDFEKNQLKTNVYVFRENYSLVKIIKNISKFISLNKDAVVNIMIDNCPNYPINQIKELNGFLHDDKRVNIISIGGNTNSV